MWDEDKMAIVLEVMNEQRKSAQSMNMMALTSARIKMLVNRREGFEKFSINDVLTALDYMAGNQVTKVVTKHKVVNSVRSKAMAKKMGRPANSSVSVTKWKLTQKGVVSIEGENAFSRSPATKSIIINATNSQVMVGNDNVLLGNIRIVDKLTELEQLISESDHLDLKSRQNIVADIESLKAQMSKPQPSKSLIKALWLPVAKAADIAGLADLASSIAQLLFTD